MTLSKTSINIMTATVAVSLSACGGESNDVESVDCRALPAGVEERFEQMTGPLGCAPTDSLVPDPPEGCEGAKRLVATAKQEYARLSQEGNCSQSVPDLAPMLAAYEADFASKHPFIEHRIDRDGFSIAAREFGAEHAGAGPTLILMHGFPDNQHLYDRIAPALGRSYRTITFDFVGWGHSTRPPADHVFTAEGLLEDLEAVVDYFHLTDVVPVVHDASGWPGIDWALDHESQVVSLVLLNTTYHAVDGLKPPYVIRALSALDLRPQFLDALGSDDLMNAAVFRAQVGAFFTDNVAKEKYLPILQASIPGAALVSLTESTRSTVLARNANVPRMQAFEKPVLVAFGADDPFLNETAARAFASTFPNSKLELVPNAAHYVQLDQPDAVVEAIRSAAGG